jgi:LCP family protein required for cell wall assembly
MSDFSDGWFREPGQRPPQQAATGRAYPGSGQPTENLPAGGYPGGSPWPQQPPVRGGGSPGGGYPGGGSPGRVYSGRRPPGGGARRWLRPRRILGLLALLIVLILVFTGVMYFYLNSKLTRADVLVDYTGRPVAGAGQNWLITGDDSRQGLTPQQQRQLATGKASSITGARSDTIMLLHIPSNGTPPTLVSIPRDSYVMIPGQGMNKINAAFAFGGPKLLAETLQNATGLHISHYMGIGFGGLVNVVNAVGGVRICLKTNLNDPASGLHLKAGCQVLNGGEALGFVRTRHLFATQDLQREQDQRVFMKALLTKMTSTGNLINPFTSIPAAIGSADALTVDSGTQLYQLASVAFALRHPQTTTVPIGSEPVTAVGDVVVWSPSAQTLFHDLNHDLPVPKSLITGSQVGAAS